MRNLPINTVIKQERSYESMTGRKNIFEPQSLTDGGSVLTLRQRQSSKRFSTPSTS